MLSDIKASLRHGLPLVVLVVTAVVIAGCAQLMADTIETLMKDGIDLLTAGKYDAAAGKFLEVVGRDPKSWNGYLYLARAYIGKGSWTDAIASGRKALELAPSSGDVVPTLAQALLGGGTDALNRQQFSEAANHLVEYVKLRPADGQGYLQYGRALLGTGAYADALRALGQGLSGTPDASTRQQLVSGLLDGGRQALAVGNAKAAVDFLQEYVRHDQGNVSAYLSLGKAYWQDGNLGSALSAFQRVLELNPNEPEAQQFLGGRR
jgi:tetratricopeptide (TPR) repeat protein